MNRITDPLPFIRSFPERFLRQVPATGHELAAGLAGDVVLLTDAPATLARLPGGWWVVGAEVDWLAGGDSTPDSGTAFRRILPLPAAGANSMRVEVLIGAFASVAVTISASERRVVVGVLDDQDEIWGLLDDHSAWARSVAFKL